ncbi:MAG: antitoxin Xre/MbcA/ParS toxin-binding domain-containing protein [Gemmatimonadaceae bacterium]
MRKSIRSLADLRRAVESGLPKRALALVVEQVEDDPQERRRLLSRIVPIATYKRRKTVLKPHESERTERLARVIALARDAWGDDEEARRFLRTPHALLGDERPLDVAQTELGARQVEELLTELRYGLPV